MTPFTQGPLVDPPASSPASTRERDLAPLVRARGLCKSFGGVDVLIDVDLELRPGEVHGLVGENGAGKSTLAKIISGVHTPRAGHIEVNGKATTLDSPRAAIAHRIALIHQDPLTFPELSVAENIFIGRQPRRGGRVDWRGMEREAEHVLRLLGVRLDPRTKVRGLSIADQQMVEMAAALSQNANVLVMDETTAALTPTEARRLMGIMRRLRDAGTALAFIGHRMEEIFDVCDRITILRDGRVVGHRRTVDITVDEVLRLIVGRPFESLFTKDVKHTPGPVVVEVHGLSRRGEFSDITFNVRAGEIVSLAGLVGAGRTQVVETIFGLRRPDMGQVLIDGQPARIAGPREAIAHGLAMVPEDRQHHGVLMPTSVWRNATLTVMGRWSKLGWLRDGPAKAAAGDYVNRLAVRLREIGQPIRELSGGNQQKIVLSKWLLTGPRVMILDEPTRGIDIGAKAEVHRLIAELAAAGTAVLMVSSDLPEVLAMSDRVLVMREGRLVAELDRSALSAENVIAAATGQVLGQEKCA
jgi:rhamnose transport system ATP-binding protein